MTTEQILAAANVVSALAIVVLIVQVFMARQQSREDHERSRREKAIDLLFQWANSVTETGADARRFCERLTPDQIERLYKFKDNADEPRIAIPAADRPFLDRALKLFSRTEKEADRTTRLASNPFPLTAEEIIYIRWHFISYTNLTEAVLSAWVHNTADKGMVQEQFKFLYDREAGYNLIKNFKAASNNACPALTRFVEDLHDEMVKAQVEERKRTDRQYRPTGS